MFAHIPARPVGKVAGRTVSRFVVIVRCNDSRRCRTVATHRFDVLSHTAADAVNFIRDAFRTRPETEVETMGVRGGLTSRFVGWETAVAETMRDGWEAPEQFALALRP